jgi:hypothetical protein
MIESIIAEIDKEIASLQQVRGVLAVLSPAPSVEAPRRGRKKGLKNAAAAPVKAKRVMSDEGRARISAAMKKRHAAKKRAAKKGAAAQMVK